MKSIDVDAQYMIRTYIDSIEEYLRKNTKIHPNEIDGLLSEINDFVHLRSREISTAPENRVRYADVLKAIEECGSPSEICDQYLKEEEDVPENQIETDSGEVSKQQRTLKQKETSSSPIEGKYIGGKEKSDEKTGFWNSVLETYEKSPAFFGYRLIFLCLLLITLHQIINFRPFDYYYLERDVYSGARFLQLWIVTWVIENYTGSITVAAFFIAFLEGFIVKSWKSRLRTRKGFSSYLDDSLILWLSRISFLLIFLKASLLFRPTYIWYIPVWLFLMIIVERQLESTFWHNQLAPWFTKIGIQLASDDFAQNKTEFSSLTRKIESKFSRAEGILQIVMIGFFSLTFLWPWSFMPYQTYSRYTNQDSSLGYNVESVLKSISIIPFLTIILIIFTFFLISYYKNELKLRVENLGILLWAIRLLIFRSMLLLLSYGNGVEVLGIFVLAFCLVVTETLFNTFGGDTFRLGLAAAFVKLGSSDIGTADLQNLDVKNGTRIPVQNIQIQESQPQQSIVVPPETLRNTQQTHHPLEQKEIYPPAPQPGLLSYMGRFFRLLIHSFIYLLSWIGIITKTIFLSLFLLVFSAYEVILAFIIITTSFNLQGVYQVPNLYFDLTALGMGIWHLGGYMIWNWYALLLLGIQLFIITLIDFYSIIQKRPEGGSIKIAQILSRIFLVLTITGTGYFAIVYWDVYAQLRLLVALSLLIFSVVTHWKARTERKHWKTQEKDTGEGNLEIHNSQEQSIRQVRPS